MRTLCVRVSSLRMVSACPAFEADVRGLNSLLTWLTTVASSGGGAGAPAAAGDADPGLA